MAFNKSWNYLKSDWSSTDSLYGNADEDEERKRPTIDNNYQTTIPQFDPRIDETTGWKGVEPVTAIRVQSNHRKAGQAVPQDASNKNFEGGDPRLPQRIPEIPHDDDPVWNDPDSRWSKDPKSGSRYYMSGKYEDGKYNPRGKKHFADLKNAKAGTWAAKNTVGDIRNLYTHNNHEKLVYIRGNLDKYGKVHRRDSDEAQEDLAEAFIEHDKDIPRESLVEVPLRDHYIHQTREMGTPDLGPNRRSSEKGRISRWNDKPVPWGESREPTKKIEDMNDDEFQEFQESLYDKTPEEIHELTKGSPMNIAFRLLKDSYPDGYIDDTGYNPANSPWKEPQEPSRPLGLMSYSELKQSLENAPEGSEEQGKLFRERKIRASEKRAQIHGELAESYPRFSNNFQDKLTGEPMEIAFQLLKERKSPAAFAHKLEYDKQYQKDPKRVKYREQLNTERRKRGIYGKGGKDVSHTQGGKLTLESAHSNRARHFKNKGTLRRVKVKK